MQLVECLIYYLSVVLTEIVHLSLAGLVDTVPVVY